MCHASSILFGVSNLTAEDVTDKRVEHARNWREVISNIKNVCKPNGIILITTRSKGFRLHGYPHDYWRYELDDMRKIFGDCEILVLESDRQAPGVFIKAKKLVDFKEVSLKDIPLYSVIEKDRILTLDPKKEKKFQKRYKIYRKIIKLRSKIEGVVFRLFKILAF